MPQGPRLRLSVPGGGREIVRRRPPSCTPAACSAPIPKDLVPKDRLARRRVAIASRPKTVRHRDRARGHRQGHRIWSHPPHPAYRLLRADRAAASIIDRHHRSESRKRPPVRSCLAEKHLSLRSSRLLAQRARALVPTVFPTMPGLAAALRRRLHRTWYKPLTSRWFPADPSSSCSYEGVTESESRKPLS